MKKLMRVLWIVAAVALGAVIVLQLRAPPIEVETSIAEEAPLQSVVEEDGKTRVRERYVISAPVAGTLARAELHAGDAVAVGDVVARILPARSALLDPRSAETAARRVSSAQDALLQAQAGVSRADAAAGLARSELARAEQLRSHQAATAQQLEAAQVEVRVRESDREGAQFAARIAQHELEAARAALGVVTGKPREAPLELRAPSSGRVLRVLQESEGAVAPGTPLLEIGDPRRLEIVSDVLTTDAVQIRPGMSAQVQHWGGAPIPAVVRRVEPSAFTRVSALGVEEQRVNVVLDLDAPPEQWGALGDNFAVEVRVILWQSERVLQVPSSALFRSREGWAVFAIEDRRVHIRAVDPGHRAPLETEITRGLAPGTRVVIHPGTALEEGTRVAHR